MADVEISNRHAAMNDISMNNEIIVDSPVETVGEVEVTETARKPRTRRRTSKIIELLDDDDDDDDEGLDEEEIPIAKRQRRRRRMRALAGESTKAKRRRRGNRGSTSDEDCYEPKGKDKTKERTKNHGRRKREKPGQKNTKETRPRNRRNNNNKRGQSSELLEIDHSSGEDSVVVIGEEVRPPSHSRHAPHGLPGVSSWLGDSSTDSSSSSDSDGEGSSSSSSSDSVISAGSVRVKSPTPPPLVMPDPSLTAGINNWFSNSLSGRSESDSDGDYINNGSADNGGSPPRSPSSASSESPDKSFQCHYCKKWFSSNVTLRAHRRTHNIKPNQTPSVRSSRRYECDCCEATFSRRERLEQHKLETHRGDFTERCEVCNRGFEDEEQQRKHLATHTQDERMGRCSECGDVFSNWEQLKKHRASHAPSAPQSCPLCRKSHSSQHSLNKCNCQSQKPTRSNFQHLQNHSKAVFRCVVCKTSFEDANKLAKHLNSHLDRYKRLKS